MRKLVRRELQIQNERSDEPGIAVVCAVKNRFEPLQFTIPTYLSHPNVKQLIIVDWDSDIPVRDRLDQMELCGWPDDRVSIVRAENQPYWNSARAYNLAMMFVTQPLTLKIDADVAIVDHVLDRLPVSGQTFTSGTWRFAKTLNAVSLFGTVFFATKDFRRVGGYDERFTTYGHEDGDLYLRLRKLELAQRIFKPNVLFHLPHSDLRRTAHLEVKCQDLLESIALSRAHARRRKRWSRKSVGAEFVHVQGDHLSNYKVVYQVNSVTDAGGLAIDCSRR